MYQIHTPLPRHVALGCAFGGLLMLALTVAQLALSPTSTTIETLWLALSFLLLAGLSAGLLASSKVHPSLILGALLPIGLAFFLRSLCMDYQSHDYLTFLADWSAFFRDNGGFAAVALPKGNYNVPYLYFLAGISYAPVSDLYLIKLFSLLFDVLLAWGGLRLVQHFTGRDSAKPAVAFCLLLLLPTVILNGAYWGQCDSIYGALCLHGLACGLNRQGKRSVILVALAFTFKLQTIFLLPLWAILWFGGRVKFRHLFLFPLTYGVTIVPALLLGKPIMDILMVYVGQTSDQNTRLTFNAPSIYALIPYYKEVDIPQVAKVGIIVTFALLLVFLLAMALFRKRLNSQSILTCGLILAVAIPLLLPYMHDRYFFLADILVVCYAVLHPRRTPLALLTLFASLGAYHAYLLLRYAYPMSWGAMALIVVLLSSLGLLTQELRQNNNRKKHPNTLSF